MAWSLTSLKMFEQCNLKYKFRYVDKLKETKSAAADRGIDNHRIVELFIRGEFEGNLPNPLDFYQQFFTTLREHPNKFPEHRIALKRDLSVGEWEGEDTWHRSVLDLKVLHSETLAIGYDWKTGKIYGDHDEQKELYSLDIFAEHHDVQEVQFYHVYLDSNQTRQRTYFRSQVSSLWEGWKTRVSFLERTETYIPSPGYHCRWCPFSKSVNGPCRF